MAPAGPARNSAKAAPNRAPLSYFCNIDHPGFAGKAISMGIIRS
jgi:hypothetical protein